MGSCPICKIGGDIKKNELFVPQFDGDIILDNANKNRKMTKLIRKKLSKMNNFHRLTTEKIIRAKNLKNCQSVILKKTPNNLLKYKRNISFNFFQNELKKTKSVDNPYYYNLNINEIYNKENTKNQSFIMSETTLKRFKTTIKLNNKNNLNSINITNTINELSIEEDQNEDEKSIKYEFSEQIISSNEEINISNILSHHYLFHKIKKEALTFLINELKEFQIEEKTSIFYKGDEGSCIFIIKKGKVEINNNNNQKFYLNEGNIFGELAVLNYNIIRNYDAFSFTNLNFYSFDFNSFENISKDILKKNDFNCIIFNGFDLETINNLHYLTNHILFKKNQIINDLNYLFEIISGELILIDDKNNQIDNYTNGDYFHFKNCFEDNQKEDYNNIFYYNNKYTLIAKEDTSCNIFPAFAFIEIFGPNFKKEIMFNFLKASLSKEAIFEEMIGKNYDKIYPIFKFNEYKRGELIYDIEKENKNIKKKYKKICIVLSGIAIKKTGLKKFSKNITVFPGDIVGMEFPFGENPLNILVNTIRLITYECYYEDFLENIPIADTNLRNFVYNIKKIYLFHQITGFELFRLIKKLKTENFKKNDKVIQKGDLVEKVYYIIKGKAKFEVDDLTYKEYNEGNSFGEIFLLNEKNAKSEIKCSSDELLLYSLDKNDFYELLSNSNINNLIKEKLCLEDIELFPNNLYYISTLYNGKHSKIYLVHNKIYFYVIKAIYVDYQKRKNPKNKISSCIINEKKASKRLDHPFIISYVKTLRNNHWCFFVEEYINGISLSEYIEMNKIFKNINLIKFYGASLFLILDNLKSRGIIHRDIKLENIIITKKGYIKLIDFSSSKRIKNNKTRTLIGTPFYIAPEILNGKGYSYSCDYWSVGIILYYLFYGEFPFGKSALKIDSVYKEILNKNIDYYENECKDNLIIKNFLQLILERNEKKRLCSLNKIIECDFYKDFSFKLLLKEKMEPPFLPQVVKIDEKNLLHNLSNPFLNFIQNEKIESDRKNSILKFHKDALRNEDNNQNYDNCNKGKNWFDDF
jgi:serine/threonine protein kinase/CRP-like cAMP-binding protein